MDVVAAHANANNPEIAEIHRSLSVSPYLPVDIGFAMEPKLAKTYGPRHTQAWASLPSFARRCFSSNPLAIWQVFGGTRLFGTTVNVVEAEAVRHQPDSRSNEPCMQQMALDNERMWALSRTAVADDIGVKRCNHTCAEAADGAQVATPNLEHFQHSRAERKTRVNPCATIRGCWSEISSRSCLFPHECNEWLVNPDCHSFASENTNNKRTISNGFVDESQVKLVADQLNC
jgi:hypothetical protein